MEIDRHDRPYNVQTLEIELCLNCLGFAIVSDMDGDRVRCRWAEGRAECGGICGALPGFTLDPDQCTLHISGNVTHGLYAFAIQIEDFLWNNETYGALSSVPMQFIVEVWQIWVKLYSHRCGLVFVLEK